MAAGDLASDISKAVKKKHDSASSIIVARLVAAFSVYALKGIFA